MPDRPIHPPDASLGLLTGSLAFVSWGLVPLYWKLLQKVPAMEILAHRLVWSFAFSALLLCGQRRWDEIARVLRAPRQVLLLVLSGTTICGNWFIFIWAVNSGHILQTSLGYFMMPLVNVLLGAFVFGERLRLLQWMAVALAAVGVGALAFGHGSFPWVAVVLCASFALYGMLRKTSRAEALPGLFLESAAIAPFTFYYLLRLSHTGAGAFSAGAPATALLLAGGGIVTALPLIWFAHAARNLRLSTLGLLQYLAPTLTFLLGTLLYHEPFTRAHLFTFGCIWTGLALYTFEGRWHLRKTGKAAESDARQDRLTRAAAGMSAE
jgi:chloramphenicol-sensitive protein RarD